MSGSVTKCENCGENTWAGRPCKYCGSPVRGLRDAVLFYGGIVMKDVEFMTAKEKEMVLKQWETFLKGGCQEKNFTDRLYKHLTLHCSFIAHYNRAGFYSTYFENGEDMAHFLTQFDCNGLCKSVEYGDTFWIKGNAGGDYEDINSAMIKVASKYVSALVESANTKQRDADIAKASALFAKHGINFGYEEKREGSG